MKTRYRVDYILFIVAMLSIGSASILVRLSNASAIACAFWRLFFSVPIIFLIAVINSVKLFHSYIFLGLKYAILSGVALALHFVMWMDSLFKIPISISTTIVVAYPIHLLLLEAMIFREMPSKKEVAGIAIAFIGIGIFFSHAYIDVELNLEGVLESFIASILAAIYFYIGRIARRSLDIYSYTIPTYIIGALTVLLYNYIFTKDNILYYIPSSLIWLLLLAIIPMIGGHTVMNYLLKHYKSSIVTSIALAEPAIATLLAIPILSEVPRINHVIAIIITLFGIFITLKGR